MGNRDVKNPTCSRFSIYLFLVIELISILPVFGQFPGIPPILQLDRNWRIPEDEPVGTRVAQARLSSDSEHLPVTFALGPTEFLDGSKYFRIDPKTGAIYLNESMEGRRGLQYYVNVIASVEGGLKSRTEVWIHITPALNKKSGQNTTKTPSPTDIQTTKNPQNIFPPTSIHHQYNGPPGHEKIIPQFPNSNPVKTIFPPDFLFNSSQQEISTPKIPSEDPISPIYPPHLDFDGGKNYPNNGGKNDNLPPPYSIETKDESPITEISDNSVLDSNENNIQVNSTNSEQNSQNNQIAIYTIVPIVLLFGLVPVICTLVWFFKKKRNKLTKRLTKEFKKETAGISESNMTTSMSMISGSESPPTALQQWIGKKALSNRYESYDPDVQPPQVTSRYEFPRHHLQICGILGEGCFGQVWRCEALNIDGVEGSTTVAVKTLKESAGERERSDLISELAVMKGLDPHPNVVRLLGACTEKDPIFLIMEYVALGKLQTFLRSSRAQHYYGNLHGDSNSLTSKDLISFAYQVARGMEFLSSKGIIHRDLAARNILLDKDRVCKVADFGFARDVVDNHVYERKSDGRLPIRWMSPEALYDNIYTTKSDVWSFGVLGWEVTTLGSTPYPGMAASEVMRNVRDGYRLEKPEHCRRELYNIMFYCWAHSPDDRPTFSELVTFLRQLLTSETDYIELDRFPDHNYYNMSSLNLSGEKL